MRRERERERERGREGGRVVGGRVVGGWEGKAIYDSANFVFIL